MSTVEGNQNRTRGQFMAPGWYPDPAPPTNLRRWDGFTWTDETAPGPAPAPAVARTADPAGARQLWDLNVMSLSAVAISLVYLLIDNYTHIVIFGIVPISLAIRAVRRREPLCAAAIVGTVLAVAAPFFLHAY